MSTVNHTILLKRLQNVFDSVLPERVALSEALTAQDVNGWDSLQHVKLMLAVEKEFSIRFTLAEINGMADVGDLLRVVSRKLAERA